MTNWSQGTTGADIRALTFARAGVGTRGYDMVAVDAFLDRVATALDGTGRPVPAAEVRDTTFRTARFGRRGYATGDVDLALDRLEQQCRARFG